MSLLEDIFLQDEAGEAQELERIIEGDDIDERPREVSDSDENSEREDEAEEDKRRVEPTAKAKKVVKNPRFVLNPARLTGPRGIQIIPEHFKDFQFKGKGHEKEDLDMVLKKLEHWAYRLYPKFKFEDCLKKIETLGKKRPVMVHLHKIRSDQFLSEETVVQKDSSDDEALPEPQVEEDEFDKLLQQQIELARSTPAPGSVMKPGFSTPVVDKRPSEIMPKATSSPSISDEQKERMMKNRKMAEERRLARLKANTLPENSTIVDLTNGVNTKIDLTKSNNDTIDLTNVIAERNTINNSINVKDGVDTVTDLTNYEDEDGIRTKRNRLNVIDSSDDDEKENTTSKVTEITEGNDRTNCNDNQVINLDSVSNDVDSSDDDDANIAAINRAIVVDVHKSFEENSDHMIAKGNKSLQQGVVNNLDADKIDNIEIDEIRDDINKQDDSDGTKDIEMNNGLNNSEEFEETESITKNLTTEIPIQEVNEVQDKNKEVQVNEYDTQAVVADINNEETQNDSHKKCDSETNKEKTVDAIDDLMDVDFSEDF